MTSLVERRLPVVFDTCTKPTYYADVHRLLCLPEGGVIRYDYQSKHISPEMCSAFDGTTSFETVLIAYAQARAYQKGGPVPSGMQRWEDMLWVGTRLAHLLDVWPEQRGNDRRYILALQVQGYPIRQEELVDSIFRPLHERGEVPYKIWVAQSPMVDERVLFTCDDLTQGWSTVIDRMSGRPSQFADDSFWRVSGVRCRPMASEVIRGSSLTTKYRLPELGSLELALEVHTPGDKARYLAVQAPQKGPLDGINGTRERIERFRPIAVRGRTTASNLVRSRDALVRLRTDARTTDYAEGSEVDLLFTVRKSAWRVWLSALLAAAAIAAGVVAAQEPLAVRWRIAAALVGALAAVLTALVWTGKVGIPPLKS